MSNKVAFALMVSASCLALQLQPAPASAQQAMRTASNNQSNMGGGFVEFLFGGEQQQQYQPRYPQYQQQYEQAPMQRQRIEVPQEQMQSYEPVTPAQPAMDPKYEKQLVEYSGKESPGTVVIDTPNKFLYLVQGGGKALRYGVGVGKPGFTWSGVKRISAKREWPDWTPPTEMLKRRPDLPRHMAGGPENPLGARAMYLGSTLYRIHGSNEPWTIGTNVSSGCIRMRNQDVIDLYGRVSVGARVVII